MKLVVFSGLPGTGKSTLAENVARRLGAAWLRVDVVEAAILKAGLPPSFETGLAAYIACRDLAADQLRMGRDVVIDAVNGVEPARSMWRELSREFGADRFTIEVRCSDLVEHRRRVESRVSATPPLPAPTWPEVAHREFAPWEDPTLVIDNVGDVADAVERIARFVGSG